jgi:mannose/fructose/N-acetylgalactosamine-specific phosphotransferase system component IIC
MENILLYSFIAALCSLDITAFGQFMISRPIVCGPLFGYLCGDIKTGLWIGMMVEMIWISAIPMGAAIPQDVTSVAILSSVWALRTFPGNNNVAVLAMVLGVLAGILFKKIDIWLRFVNVRVVHWVEEGVAGGKESRVSWGVYAGLLLFFVKAFIFYAVIMYPGEWLVIRLYPQLGMGIISGLEISWRFLPVLGFAMMFMNFRNGKFPCRR